MTFAGINYVAILIAAVAAFIFGWIYYMTLSTQWMAALGKKKEDMKPSATPLVVSILGLVVMAWVLAGTMGHLGAGQVTIKNGVVSALFLWLGFVVTTLATNNSFGGRKFALTAIDSGHWLGVLVIQGAIIGAMGVGKM